jgi:hypothetical protein
MSRLREVFTRAAELLRPLAERLETGGPEVYEVNFYDIAYPTFGACADCVAWPGDLHSDNISPCARAGTVFSGDWHEDEIRVVLRCADVLDDLATEVASNDPRKLARLTRAAIRRLEDMAHHIGDADGSTLPPEADRREVRR